MLTAVSTHGISGAASALVKRPIGRVFDYVGYNFFENYPRWSPHVVEFQPLTAGPTRVGACARQVTVDRGVRTESTFEIAAFCPPRKLAIKGATERFGSAYEFESEGDDATRVSFRFELAEKRLFMRPFRKFLLESLQEGARRTVENLKEALETEGAVESSPERLARFVYVTSLDLQEPLRKIEAFSDLLENAMASSNKADMAYAQEAVRGYAANARKLVDDLLTYSSTILDGQHLEVLDLRLEIEAVLGELREVILETASRIELEAPNLPFLADRLQFACLLRNILTNAIKYRKKGEGAKVHIHVKRTAEKIVCLSIEDQGVGFNEEFAQAIFEPFTRMPGKAEYPGTGIELAICKSVADRHGWGISVKARPGEGAGFYFTIPTVCETERNASSRLGALTTSA